MREILFRSKGNTKYNDGSWYEGYLKYDGTDYQILDTEYGSCARTVISETVGQYTGLTDKNGKKIFEGDILNTTNSNCAIWYVDYKNTAFCCNQGNANYSCVLDEFTQYSDVEVIGNIHDNPELLEVNRNE
ncbi:MAG: YopX family protein [Ruminococcus sp.]